MFYNHTLHKHTFSIIFLYYLECGTSDAQMGFCIATSGLTHGGQGEDLADLQMDEPSEEPEQDTVESMDADEDTEVHPLHGSVLNSR